MGMNTWRLRITGLPGRDASGTDARVEASLQDGPLISSVEASLRDGPLISIREPSASSGWCFPSEEQESSEDAAYLTQKCIAGFLYLPFLITFLSDLIFKLATVPWVTSTTRKEQLLGNMPNDSGSDTFMDGPSVHN